MDSNWYPIETAPRDEYILTKAEGAVPCVKKWHSAYGDWVSPSEVVMETGEVQREGCWTIPSPASWAHIPS